VAGSAQFMRVAVIGASGFIGQSTARALLEAGHEVVGVSRGKRGRPAIAGVIWRDADAATGATLAAALHGCEVVVNLVGIKRPERGQGFREAHVEAVRALVAGCRAAGVRRIVHVGVAGTRDDPRRPYLASKFAGEREVMSSGTGWTIIRPGPVYGPGDDFVRNLAATIRHAGVFPAPDGGRARLQPVAVEDVAAAIVAAVEREAAAGKIYDVVGPERLTLAEIVRRVAAAIGLPITLVPCPAPLLAVAVGALERLRDPLLTRAQLGLLTDGVVGDPGPARADLGIEPRALTRERIAALAEGVRPWLGVSLRLRRGDEDRFFGTCPGGLLRVAGIVALGVALIAGLGAVTQQIWWRMLAANAILAPLCVAAVPLPWRALWRPSWRALVAGVLAAGFLLVAGWLVSQVLFAVMPGARAQAEGVYAWVGLLPPWQAGLLLPAIAAGEETVWRGAVAFAVAARAGPWWGCAAAALAFAAVHVSLGLPALVVAAAGAGLFWAWLGLKTRSLFAVLVCHVLWDACVAALRLY
jgi:uncharacterized protein YbjT (DUF2867 family)/membrane protease YdiL (CAAX protease family)